MIDFIGFSNFVKKNLGKSTNKKEEEKGQKFFSLMYDYLSDLAEEFDLKNITKKQGGGVAQGTRAGRQFKEYIWYKIAAENMQDFPVSISIFVFSNHLDVSLQLDEKKVEINQYQNILKDYESFYTESINKKLDYYVNEFLIDSKRFEYIYEIKNNQNSGIDRIVPKYMIPLNDNKKIEREIRCGIELIYPLYVRIIENKRNSSKDPFEIFDFESTNNFNKKHRIGVHINKACFSRDIHYQIQKKLIEELVHKYRKQAVKAEVKINNYRADVMVKVSDNEYEIYEVKPYILAKDCIREATGQLLEYKYCLEEKITGNKNTAKKLVIVGLAENTVEVNEYISFLNKLARKEIFEYKQISL